MSTDPSQPQPTPQPIQTGPPTSGLAIASLVLGILSVALCGLGCFSGIPAVICGHMALSAIKQSNGQLGGQGMALAGTITGWVMNVFSIIILLIYGTMILAILGGAAAGDDGYQELNIEEFENLEPQGRIEWKAPAHLPSLYQTPSTPWV